MTRKYIQTYLRISERERQVHLNYFDIGGDLDFVSALLKANFWWFHKTLAPLIGLTPSEVTVSERNLYVLYAGMGLPTSYSTLSKRFIFQSSNDAILVK